MTNAITNPCGKGSQNFHAHPEDDTKYIQCTQWGQMFIFSCPDGLRWDGSIMACEKRNKFASISRNLIQSTTQQMVQFTQGFTKPQVPIQITTQRVIPQQQQQQQQQQQTVQISQQMQQNQVVGQQMLPQQQQMFSQQPQMFSQQPQMFSQQPQQPQTQTQQQQTFPQQQLVQQPQQQQQQQTFPQQQQSSVQSTQQMTIQPVQQTQTQPQQSNGMTEGFQTFQSSNTIAQPVSEASQASGSGPLSSKCTSITIRNSMVSIVNGAYNQISQGMYKRSDDLRLPGLVASIRNHWCISYSFTLSDLERMNQATFNTACANLDCCILVSDSNPVLDIADQKRQWKINLLENKGQVDQNIKIECDGVSKSIKFFNNNLK